jgi:hypothetical protein
MIRTTFVLSFVAACVLGLWLRGCSGARPRVVSQELRAPTGAGQPFQADATIRNEGLGEGEVQVVFRLVARSGGRALVEARRVELRRREAVHVSAPVWAPRGEYSLEVEAHYPPR